MNRESEQKSQEMGGQRIQISSMEGGQNEIDLAELVEMLWRGKLAILLSMLVMVSLCLVYVFVATPKYEAETVLVPVNEDNQAAMLRQLGGLAAIAGISAAPKGEAQTHQAVIESLSFMKHFVETYGLLTKVYESCWDVNAATWIGKCAENPPTELHAAREVQKWFRIANNTKSGLVTISLRYKDSEKVVFWVNEFVREANRFLRHKAMDVTEKNIAFLKNEINNTQELEIREVLYRMLEQEMQTQKLAGNRENYAFEVIDPAFPPRKPVSPRRLLLIALSLVVGGIIGAMWVFLRPLVKQIKTRLAPA
jgi:LPS O-antigen subunit length determinant protein (WzzB/FepE family)